MILNHYLSKFSWNQDKNYLLHYAHTELANGQICQQVIEDSLLNAAYKDAVILTTVDQNSQGHAVTLKRNDSPSQGTNTWYILDSQNNHPQALLTHDDWRHLQGSIIVLKQRSIWDGLNPYSDIHLAGSSFPFNPETFVYNNMASLLDTIQEPAPATPPTLMDKTKLNGSLQTHCPTSTDSYDCTGTRGTCTPTQSPHQHYDTSTYTEPSYMPTSQNSKS